MALGKENCDYFVKKSENYSRQCMETIGHKKDSAELADNLAKQPRRGSADYLCAQNPLFGPNLHI